MVEHKMVEYKEKNIWCAITTEPLDILTLSQWSRSDEAGAVTTFEGTTRNHFEEKVVTTLSYECHMEMALQEMVTICIIHS